MKIEKCGQIGLTFFFLFWTVILFMTPARLQAAPLNESETQAVYERLSLEKTSLEKRIQAAEKVLYAFPQARQKLAETVRGLQELQLAAPAAADWPSLLELGKRLFDGPGIKTSLGKLSDELGRLPKEALPSKPAEDVGVITKKTEALSVLVDRFSLTLAMDKAATKAKLVKDKPEIIKLVDASGGQADLMLLQVKTQYILAEASPLLEQTKAVDQATGSFNQGLQASVQTARTALTKVEGQLQYLLRNYPIKVKGDKKP